MTDTNSTNSTNSMSHAQFGESIAAYLAGGLDAAERAAFEAHAASCAPCAAALEQALRIDRRLEQLFGDERPTAGLEDRVVQRLRAQRLRRRIIINPALWRAAGGVAAALMLGAVGYVANSVIEAGRLPWEDAPPSAVAVNSTRGEAAGSTRWDKGVLSSGKSDAYGNDEVWFKKESLPLADEMARLRISQIRDHALATPGVNQFRVNVRNYTLHEPALGTGNGARATGIATNQEVHTTPAVEVQTATDLKSLYTLDLNAPLKVDALGAIDLLQATPEGDRSGAAHFANRDGAASSPSAAFGAFRGGGGEGRAPQSGQQQAGELSARALGKPEDHHFFKPMELAQFQAKAAEANGAPGDARDQRRESKAALAQLGTAVRDLDEGEEVAQNQPAQPALQPPGSSAQQQPPQPPQVVQPPLTENAVAMRKIIRNGEMEFEVDGFDSAFVQITKIVGEENGFVSSTNSEKLPNGKVRGTVILRVPPDRLDTLILKLRALGDLRSQRISAQDVTKVYYDLESELKAARTMEERLLNIIKSGKGEIKDLLEAEKQLGVYRERIEKLEGEIRYYNNLVSLSTLSITLYERDLRQSGLAAQTEQVNAGIETEDVEQSRADAIKAIEEARGRIVESNLKKFDAGQLGALIVADVAPDAAGPLIDRLKQLGRVARLDIERKQTTPTGTAPLPQARVERRETRFTISLYNLANIAPRQTTSMSMAVADVEQAYRSILESVGARSGRIVTSSLNRQKPEQTTATISFEVPSADADATLLEIRREREVMALTVTENPDTSNVTSAKRGFSVQIVSLATVPARETEQQVLATRQNVAETFRLMLEELKKAEARILVSQLNQQDPANVSGQLDFEVVRAREAELRTALAPLADLISRTVTRSSDVENTVDSKVRLQVRLLSIDQLAPRITQSLGMAVKDVPAAHRDIVATLQDVGSRILTSQLNEQDPQHITGSLDFDVLRENLERIEKAMNAAGVVYSRAVTRSADTQNTVETKLRMQLTLRNVEQLPPRQTARVMIETADVDKSRGDLIAASDAAGGRTIQDAQAIASNGEVSSHLVIDVPLSRAPELRQQIRNSGTLRVSDTARDPQAPDGTVGRARFDITLTSPGLLVGRDEGLAATVKSALSTSLKGLLWSLNFILIGLLFVGPWILLLWFLWRFVRRSRSVSRTTPAAAPAP